MTIKWKLNILVDRREVVVREAKMNLNVKDIDGVEIDEKNGPLQQSKWLVYLFPRSSFHKSYWQSTTTIQKLRKSKNEVKEVMTASHSPAVGGIPLSSAVKKSSSTPHASSSPIAFFSAFGIKIEKRLRRWRGEGGGEGGVYDHYWNDTHKQMWPQQVFYSMIYI